MQEPVNPAPDHFNELLLADPLTEALPVQRGPTPAAFGPENVKDPVNELLSTVPVIWPFQSGMVDTQVPVTFVAV